MSIMIMIFFMIPFRCLIGVFTNAAGQDAPTSISRGRNARFIGVLFIQHYISQKYML
jgi:hypothetical protein